ncbi:hypothetical protein D3C81_586440 [compost metagenome]
MKSSNSCPPFKNLLRVTFIYCPPISNSKVISSSSSPRLIIFSTPVPIDVLDLDLLNNAIVIDSTKKVLLPPPFGPITANKSPVSSKLKLSSLYEAKFLTLIFLNFNYIPPS